MGADIDSISFGFAWPRPSLARSVRGRVMRPWGRAVAIATCDGLHAASSVFGHVLRPGLEYGASCAAIRRDGPADMAKSANRHPEQLQRSLEGIAILAGLSAEARERLQKRCAWRRYRPGDPIVGYLDASDDVFFMSRGKSASRSIRWPAER